MIKLKSYVDRNRVNLLQTNSPHVVSVDVRESDQLDVKHLFCGARSLLIDERSGQIVARGVNKFRDYAEVEALLNNNSSSSSSNNKSSHHFEDLNDIFAETHFWEQCHVWAVRKMAGFVVTLFALDSNELHVMSKHATDGPHVQIAKRILNTLLSAEEQMIVAHDLFIHGASVCCECIAPADDDQHPVMEDDAYHNQLVIFSIQRAHEVMELTLPFAQVMTWANKWKLPCAPAQRLHSVEDLQSLIGVVRRWDDMRVPYVNSTSSTYLLDKAQKNTKVAEKQSENLFCHAFHSTSNNNNNNNYCTDHMNKNNNTDIDCNNKCSINGVNPFLQAHFAEGVVLLLETSLPPDSSLMWRRPIRLKIKTPCYVTLRSLRSLINGDSHPQIMLIHAVIAQWAKQHRSLLEQQD